MDTSALLPETLREMLPAKRDLKTTSPHDGMLAVGALLKASAAAATWVCPDCGELVRPKEIGTRYLPSAYCLCEGGLTRMAAIRLKRAEDEIQRTERNSREKLASICGLDPSKTFESWAVDTAARRKALDTAKTLAKRLSAGQWAIWWGPYGCGKTHLANAVAYSLVLDYGSPARVINWLAQLRQIQIEWSKNDRVNGEAELWQPMLNSRVLILDDFDKGLPKPADLASAKLPSAWYMESLYFVIDERYRRNKPTVLIANQSFADLTTVLQAFGGTAVDAVLSRFSRSGATSVDWGQIGLTEYRRPADIPMF